MKRISLNKVMAKLAVEQKVELNKVENLLSWAKKGVDAYDELEQLNRLVQKLEGSAEAKLKQLDDKAQEADELRRMAKDLGATDLLNSIKMAEGLLSTNRSRLEFVMKQLQNAKS
jgi:hypothetical protein